MRYIIQKVPEREVTDILDHIPYAEIVEDHSRDAMGTLLDCFKLAGEDAFVRLEDDIYFADNAVPTIEKFIEQHPDRVITFFTLKGITETCEQAGRTFMMFQCTYLPPGMAKEIHDYFYDEWLGFEAAPTGLDTLVADYLKSRKLKYIIYHPSLVQHKICKSIINPRRSSKRQAKNFQD